MLSRYLQRTYGVTPAQIDQFLSRPGKVEFPAIYSNEYAFVAVGEDNKILIACGEANHGGSLPDGLEEKEIKTHRI